MKRFAFVVFVSVLGFGGFELAMAQSEASPRNLSVILERTQPLGHPRLSHPLLWILLISGQLDFLGNSEAASVLNQLEDRGIGSTADWHSSDYERSLAEGLRIGEL
ncbi:MAG: hypothetical protein M2R45_05367 [Verrucomicrobia subdivision 3 bacterium]|nr:hypothetical protein [Limisphaerales bacterium]MCS1417777.1 hypothetical protein [Limisphaerales bacterium]